MTDDQFERLLDALPRIAENVKQFESEQVQQQVIDGLLHALMAPNGAAAIKQDQDDFTGTATTTVGEPTAADPPAGQTINGQPKEAKKKRPKSLPNVAAVDFDWAPADTESLAEFVARKQPMTNVDRNLAVVFYLEQVAKHQPISVGHIVSGFYACGWDVPANPRNALSVARSTSKGVDTSNQNDIKMTHIGRNIVNNQLPRPGKGKSK